VSRPFKQKPSPPFCFPSRSAHVPHQSGAALARVTETTSGQMARVRLCRNTFAIAKYRACSHHLKEEIKNE
jgi:hypothetical protein